MYHQNSQSVYAVCLNFLPLTVGCVLMLQAEFEEREAAIQQKMDSAREKKTQLEQTQRYKKEQMVWDLLPGFATI